MSDNRTLELVALLDEQRMKYNAEYRKETDRLFPDGETCDIIDGRVDAYSMVIDWILNSRFTSLTHEDVLTGAMKMIDVRQSTMGANNTYAMHVSNGYSEVMRHLIQAQESLGIAG